jgi:integrase/recombinase XerC
MIGPQEMSWLELFLTYLRSERNLSLHTLRAYHGDLRQFYAYVNAQSWNLGEARSVHIRMFLTTLHKGIAQVTTARKIATLRAFYKFLVRHGYLTHNPLEQMRRPKLGKKLPIFLTLEQIERLLQTPDATNDLGKRDRAMLELLYGSGIRVSEMVSLEVSDLDFRASLVKVQGKRRKERLVPLSDASITAIEAYLAVRPRTAGNSLFLNYLGTRLTSRSIHRLIKHYAYVAGLPCNISPHTLRHTFATHLLNAGADLRALQEMLGHTSLVATQIYTHITLDRLLEVYRKSHPRS